MMLYLYLTPEMYGASNGNSNHSQNTVALLFTMVMPPSDTNRKPNQPASFEEALKEVIVSFYASSEPVEGHWEITTPLADAPNWIIDVEKVYSDDEPEYDPEFID